MIYGSIIHSCYEIISIELYAVPASLFVFTVSVCLMGNGYGKVP